MAVVTLSTRGKNEMSAVEIASEVYWIGAFDPQLRDFDIILKTATGTSYNAYCIRGQRGVVVIDTVKASHANEFFARLEQVARYEEIQAIILNHLEPDHSGALPELLRRAPQARVYLSHRGQMMLKGIIKDEVLEYTPVGTDDRIDLGERQLRFLHTPFLHWPDTQCTYLEKEGILFSGDIFGCHFCDARLFNDKVGDFRVAFDYYYAHIMRPFREPVLEALTLIEPLPLNLLAPAHGPILRDSPNFYVQRYRQLAESLLAKDATKLEQTLLIFYISAYGNTTRMAQAISEGAESVSGVRVSLYDLQENEIASLIDFIEEADGLVFGSPTINGDAVKPIWDLLSSLTLVKVRGKLGAAFGSYGWSGEAVGLIEDRLRGLKLRVPVKGSKIKLIPTDTELKKCHDFGRELALQLTGQTEQRFITLDELNLRETNHA